LGAFFMRASRFTFEFRDISLLVAT
jgi:hypothetical protein